MTTMRERLERAASQQIAKAMLDGGVEEIVLNRDHIVMDRNTGARMPGLVNIPVLIGAILAELATPDEGMTEVGQDAANELTTCREEWATRGMTSYAFTAMINHVRGEKP